MRILCEYADCGPSFVRSGWGRVLSALGHDFRFWRPEQKPALDAFAEFEPEVFLGTTYGLGRALTKALVRRPHVRVGLYASAWGGLADDMPKEYPITRAGDAEKEAVARLFKKTGQPSFVFSHVTDRYKDGLLGGWREAGVRPEGVLNAADTFLYPQGSRRPDLACDVAFVGGWWDYKARNLGPLILPLCHPSSGLRVKLFGNQPWPVAQYLGLIDDEDVSDLFVSATVCPNVSEPHSTRWGYDVVERPFKVLAAGGFCVSDTVAEMDEVFPGDCLVRAPDAGSFHDAVRHFVAHPGDRVPYVAAGRAHVLEHHTYFHRVSKIFSLLGLPEESAACMALHGVMMEGGRR